MPSLVPLLAPQLAVFFMPVSYRDVLHLTPVSLARKKESAAHERDVTDGVKAVAMLVWGAMGAATGLVEGVAKALAQVLDAVARGDKAKATEGKQGARKGAVTCTATYLAAVQAAYAWVVAAVVGFIRRLLTLPLVALPKPRELAGPARSAAPAPL